MCVCVCFYSHGTQHLPFTPLLVHIFAAGCGKVSNYMELSSNLAGAMLSRDGGSTWAMTAFPEHHRITDIIMVSANIFVLSTKGVTLLSGQVWTDYTNSGIARSTDGGATWVWAVNGVSRLFALEYLF